MPAAPAVTAHARRSRARVKKKMLLRTLVAPWRWRVRALPMAQRMSSKAGTHVLGSGAPDEVEDQNDEQNDHEDSNEPVAHLFLSFDWGRGIPRRVRG